MKDRFKQILIGGGVLAAVVGVLLNHWLNPPAAGPQKVQLAAQPLEVKLVSPPKAMIDREVKPAAAAEPAAPPKTNASVRVKEIRTFCKGCPANHSTFSIVLQNDTNEEVRVTRGEFNPSTIRLDSKPSPERRVNCDNSDFFANESSIDLDAAQMKVGQAIPFNANVSIPANGKREFSVCFLYKNLQPAAYPFFRVAGSLTLFDEQSRVKIPTIPELQVAGD